MCKLYICTTISLEFMCMYRLNVHAVNSNIKYLLQTVPTPQTDGTVDLPEVTTSDDNTRDKTYTDTQKLCEVSKNLKMERK